jgi:hypothetical protein
MVKEKLQRRAFTVLSYEILWDILPSRNKFIFKDKQPNWNVMF